MSAAKALSVAGADGSGAMFDAIARRYDLINRINSLGLDQSWRARAVTALRVLPGHRVLDLATGTADLALAIARSAPGANVLGLDPSPGMLDLGAAKIGQAGLSAHVSLALGDAEQIDAPDRSFDRVAIAFGLRNVKDRRRAIAEMRRVLVPGGRLVILELSDPSPGLGGALARFHLGRVVPAVGALLSGGEAYRYLVRSIREMPAPDVVAGWLAEAGLIAAPPVSLTLGACQLYQADRPEARP